MNGIVNSAMIVAGKRYLVMKITSPLGLQNAKTPIDRHMTVNALKPNG